MESPNPLMTPGGPGPVWNIPQTESKADTSIQSNVPTQLIIWGMVGFILVELLAVLCLIRYCCRARYVKKRKFKEREIILSDQTDLYYTDQQKFNASHYTDIKLHPEETVMVDDVRSIYSTSKPKLSTFELHLNIEKPSLKPDEEYTLRYSTMAPKITQEHKYAYSGSLNKPVFEIISHADQRPATPIKYETVKEFNLASPNRNIRKKYERSHTQPLARINYAYENTFREKGDRVEWQTANEIETIDWEGLKKMTNSYSENDWKYDSKYDWKYSSFNDGFLNAYERLLLTNIRSKSGIFDEKPVKKKPVYKKFDEHNITETNLIKKVVKDPDTDEILAVKTEVIDKSNISVIDVHYDEKIEDFEVPRLPPPLQFQQSLKRSSIDSKESATRFDSYTKKHENEDFLSSHEINIQPDAISISTNNQLDSPEDLNDYIKKLDKLEPETDKLNFSELNKNFLDQIQSFNKNENLKHVKRESEVTIIKEVQYTAPPAPPLPNISSTIVRKKITDEDRQSIASSMNKGSAHLY
ncbi:unnamed protein product [Brachionus calyciflorus]|uniref:Uncharacterized protein n=1 Tax=Brachionus calyciflorus TaxID=104777 RepID=A0A813QKH5_9BILA|nr:unnamed protein product [Brachionus calyciflorus]